MICIRHLTKYTALCGILAIHLQCGQPSPPCTIQFNDLPGSLIIQNVDAASPVYLKVNLAADGSPLTSPQTIAGTISVAHGQTYVLPFLPSQFVQLYFFSDPVCNNALGTFICYISIPQYSNLEVVAVKVSGSFTADQSNMTFKGYPSSCLRYVQKGDYTPWDLVNPSGSVLNITGSCTYTPSLPAIQPNLYYHLHFIDPANCTNPNPLAYKSKIILYNSNSTKISTPVITLR